MKIRSTKVDAGDFKHELFNRLRSTVAVNVLMIVYVLSLATHKYVVCFFLVRVWFRTCGLNYVCVSGILTCLLTPRVFVCLTTLT